MALARMRTAQGVHGLTLEQDPGSEVTMHSICGLIKSGRIPVVNAGRKKLVNADTLPLGREPKGTWAHR